RMTHGSSERIIVNSTIDLAHHLQLRAVAEGVEELGLLHELEALGCDVVQGYAISHPLSGVDLIHWLSDFRAIGEPEPKRLEVGRAHPAPVAHPQPAAVKQAQPAIGQAA
ncbi:MAG: EAL domain-containing protein, partial [Solirubrobacteraceae bacterium]